MVSPALVSHSGTRSRHGFTLVELLVVIGIIAVLISVLLPTLASARESGNRIKCAANMGQIAKAVLMYEQQWRVLPGPSIPMVLAPEVVNVKPASNSPLYYAKDPDPEFYIARQWSNSEGLQRILKASDIWSCPSATFLKENAVPVDPKSDYVGKTLGYTYLINNNSRTNQPFFFGSHTRTFSGNPPAEMARLRQTPKKLAMIRSARREPNTFGYTGDTWTTTQQREVMVKNHSEIWMVTDLDGRNFTNLVSQDFGISLSATAVDKRPFQPVHGKPSRYTRNYAFFDGHVENRRLDDAPANGG